MKNLVLAGAGFAHLVVLKTLLKQPWKDIHVTLINNDKQQWHAGMLTHWMCGNAPLDACAIDVAKLAQKANVEWIEDCVCGLDEACRSVRLKSGQSVPYDVLSLSLGGQIDSLYLESEAYRLIPVRPLENFALEWQMLIQSAKRHNKIRVAVLGGGAAGVELALITHWRLTRIVEARHVKISLITGDGLLPTFSKDARHLAQEMLEDRKISIIHGKAYAGKNGLILGEGELLPVDFVLVATTVQPQNWFRHSGLSLCADGFFAANHHQQSSNRFIFASGDCASRTDSYFERSSAYAFACAAALNQNLYRQIQGKPLIDVPLPKRTLSILNTGPKVGLMNYGAFTAAGYWNWRWKLWRDKRFVAQFHIEN